MLDALKAELSFMSRRDFSAANSARIREASQVVCGVFLVFSLISWQNPGGVDWSTLPGITDEGIKSLIEQNRGKIILLNFWATWCPPCREEFPALVKIYETYESRGLEVVGVSLNDPSEIQDVQIFLRQEKPSFSIYLAGTVEDPFYRSIDRRWTSELPLTLIYDKKGKLRYFHNEPRTYAQFQRDVQSLLK